jgi:hypothetical protein
MLGLALGVALAAVQMCWQQPQHACGYCCCFRNAAARRRWLAVALPAHCKVSPSSTSDDVPAELCCYVLQGRFQRGLTFAEFVSVIMTEPPRRP